MKKTISVLGILTSFFLFGCDSNDLKTSIIGANSEEESISTDISIKETVEKEVEIVSKIISKKASQEIIEEPIQEENQTAVTTSESFRAAKLRSEESFTEVIEEVQIENEIFEEALEEEIEPITEEEQERLTRRELHAESMKNSAGPDISLKIDGSGELIITTEDKEYHPNRSDLEAFYETLQEKNKFISEKFSFFCGEECESIGNAYPQTVVAEIEYLLDGKIVFLSCSIEGCVKNEVITNALPDIEEPELKEEKIAETQDVLEVPVSEEIMKMDADEELLDEGHASALEEIIESEEPILDENLTTLPAIEETIENPVDQMGENFATNHEEDPEETISTEEEVDEIVEDLTEEVTEESVEITTPIERIRIKIGK